MAELQTTQDQLRAAVHQNKALSREGILERSFARLFRGLVYAQIWEDPVVDMTALRIQPTDHIVCIASGGCNMMSYLTAAPAGITVVDLSPAHVALSKLKLAAAQHLPNQAAFYGFFAEADRPQNPSLYRDHIAPHLDAASRNYWEGRSVTRRRISWFARGFYRFGVLGRYITATHLVSRLGRVDFRPFLASQTLAQQQTFFDTQVAPLFEMRLVKFLARRRASLFGLGIPPAQYDKLAADADGNVLAVLRERVRKLMCDFPVQENYFAWAAFNRGYQRTTGASVPPYLEACHFDTLRQNADRVTVLNQSLTDVLAKTPSASRDAYVLLDAQDWMTDAQLNALWAQITRTAAPGARVVFRTGGAPDILPGRVSADTLDQWSYDAQVSAAGLAADRSAIYGGFHVYRRAA